MHISILPWLQYADVRWISLHFSLRCIALQNINTHHYVCFPLLKMTNKILPVFSHVIGVYPSAWRVSNLLTFWGRGMVQYSRIWRRIALNSISPTVPTYNYLSHISILESFHKMSLTYTTNIITWFITSNNWIREVTDSHWAGPWRLLYIGRGPLKENESYEPLM